MKINAIISTLQNYTARTEMFEGRQHLVAPVVILKEGVHCGSSGCFLYTAEELRKIPGAWNGRPIPVLHPTDAEGNPISANDPAVIEENSVGHLFNVIWDESIKGLRGEAWVNIDKAQNKHPKVLSIVRQGARMEVSTGLWFDHSEAGSGEWEGEAYDAVAINFKTDHLALLPESTGACSLQDGCGLRMNKATDETPLYFDKSTVVNTIIALKNDLAHEDVRNQLQRGVDQLDVLKEEPGKSTIHFVLSVFDTFFVYRKESPTGVTLHKQEYSVDANGKVNTREEVVEVKEKTSYVEVNKKVVKNEKEGGNEIMKKMCPKKVTQLIENEHSKWTEDDREFLEGLEETMEDKITPVVLKEEEKSAEEKLAEEKSAEEKLAEEKLAENKEKPATKEDILSKEELESLAYGTTALKEKKDLLVNRLTSANGKAFTKAQLEAKDIAELESLCKYLPLEAEADYTGAGGGNSLAGNHKEEALVAPSMTFNKDKEKGGSE